MKHSRLQVIVLSFAACWSGQGLAQELPYRTGSWDWEKLGNHRVVVRVDSAVDAVTVEIPWRRRDRQPELKQLIVTSSDGSRINNVRPAEVRQDYGRLVFQPAAGSGVYYVYYLPFVISGRRNYPTVEYPSPESRADPEWIRRHGLGEGDLQEVWPLLQRAQAVEIQSIDPFNSFYPMEVIATADEMRRLREQHAGRDFLLFPEQREYPIRMTDQLPYRWVERGPAGIHRAAVARGEFYVFQIGLYTLRSLSDVQVTFSDLVSTSDESLTLSRTRFRCFNLAGVDSWGRAFRKPLSLSSGRVQPLWIGLDLPPEIEPGIYSGSVWVSAQGLEPRSVALELEVEDSTLPARGDDEPWRHSRLRWLDSRIALDDDPVEPFDRPWVKGRTLGVLGRQIDLGSNGFPASIRSYFASSMTRIQNHPREILAQPVELTVTDSEGSSWQWTSEGDLEFSGSAGRPGWEIARDSAALHQFVRGSIDFDGTLEYEVRLTALQEVALYDVKLELPLMAEVAEYMMGMGFKGGRRPEKYDWKWNVSQNQDSIWAGDVNAGIQLSLRDENYVRPLNTNFYLSKTLVLPTSWHNAGSGGCRFVESEEQFRIVCYSGPRSMVPGETLHFNFRLAVTPFKPIDPEAQWSDRFYHRFDPLEEIAATGANIVNVHHANEVNPFINYPFLSLDRLKEFVNAGHRRDMKVKIYYTVRELTNRAPELFALRSLGDEIFSNGPGGGFPWLQEHLEGNYIAGWLVPHLQDAAIITSGVSRWHNYYLEGLDWLMRNVGIDGLYIDDVAFDRTTMKRVRKIMDRRNAGSLIDLHSANQYNARDGFASSANLYMEHFPYIDRLWFGEYFDYDSPPDYWLVELSGIPFGLMGEMLQDGGNPWRGMLYGMTSRLPWAGDPRPLWRIWDEQRIQETEMIGYWVSDRPVKANGEGILATTYLGEQRSLVAAASWSSKKEDVFLQVDWERLQLDPDQVRIHAPAIEGFQEATEYPVGEPIPIEPGRGLLLVIESADEQNQE